MFVRTSCSMLDLYDDFLPDFAAPTGGDGASAPADAQVMLAQHQRKVQALADGETGLRFESLALFAQPLFDLYDLDASEAFAVCTAPDDADETTIAVLEAARVLWAYFALDADARTEQRDALEDFLLGPAATDEDVADLDMLLDTMEEHWDLLTPEDLELAAHDAHPTLDFEALLAHPAFVQPEPSPALQPTYGPEGLTEMEARALFAQPLLERLDDPDDLDAAMERADEYWSLAQRRGVEYDSRLDVLVDALALSADEATQIRAEAEAMTERFRSLFPEQA